MRTFGCVAVVLEDRLARAMIAPSVSSASMTTEVLAGLEQLVDWIEDDHPCDAVLIQLGGSAGADIGASPHEVDGCRTWEKLLVRIDRLECVSIALVDGVCSRFWMQLAIACDHRLLSTRAKFRIPEVKEGYLPGMNIFRLAKYIGIGVARRLIFTGDDLDAEQAATLGLADRVCAPDELELTGQRFVAQLRPIHLVAVQLARRLLNESFSTAFEQFIGQYLAAQHRCVSQLTASRDPEAQP